MNNVVLIGNPTIGADIEVFLLEVSTGRIVSAEGFVKGTKEEPYNFDSSNKYFAISLDNVSAEFCIPPVTNVTDWYTYIKKSLDYIDNSIPSHLKAIALPSAVLDAEFLATENAQRFGCEPDFNAWLRCPNEKPTASNASLRSCGGHIHIGFQKPSDEVLQALGLTPFEVDEYVIKAMDLFIGIPSVIQEPDNERKLLYGKAGAFRFKDYGVEYRTVSNYYLHSKALTEWAFNNTQLAIKFINDGRIEELLSVADGVQSAINDCDKFAADNLIRHFDIPLA